MNKATVIRYEMKPETADENQRLIEEVFTELDKKNPGRVHYTSLRLEDGVSFIHIVYFDDYEDMSDPIGHLDAFQEFQRTFRDRMAVPPSSGEATVVGAYRFIAD